MSRIGIVTALPLEARAWTGDRARGENLLEITPDLYLAVSGMGGANAERAARRLLDSGCDALVSWGTGGALRRGLRSGTVVVADRVIDERALSHRLAPDWSRRVFERLGHATEVLNAPVAGAGRILDGPHEKQRLGSVTGAAIVDMESAALACLAGQRGIPLLVVRAVVDELEVTIPSSVIAATGPDGRLHLPRLLLRLVVSPNEWTPLNRLRHGFARAHQGLKRATVALLPDLAFPGPPSGSDHAKSL